MLTRHPLLAVTFSLMLLHFAAPQTFAQRQLTGTVLDAETGEALQFANVWVRDSHKGTTTDRDGRFTLALDAGEYSVVASYIGYTSQTRRVRIPADTDLRFTLRQSTFEMPSVTVTPGDNPALRIIRRAIEMKEIRREKLKNYSLTSHSKLLVRLTGALEGMVEGSGDGNSVSVKVGVDDDSTRMTVRDTPCRSFSKRRPRPGGRLRTATRK